MVPDSTPRILYDDLPAFLAILPPAYIEAIESFNAADNSVDDLVEVVIDIGRPPVIRYAGSSHTLPWKVSQEDIDHVSACVGDFGDDDRAGLPAALHRISAIRNRRGKIIGLTCRVGRAVTGTIDAIRDLIESKKSILILGRPGAGKSTRLRETARMLADECARRVVIVDTSNELGGDGDVPHAAIGSARRMPVPCVAQQHEVMQRAVENHWPEVIVIDEIGNEKEALAARTIAERGVQLIGTAHGNTLEDVMRNPELSDLLGGIQSVILGDAEAKRRGSQKTVRERRLPPTFQILIELVDRNTMVVHHDVEAAVDALLREDAVPKEVRHVGADGQITRTQDEPATVARVRKHAERAVQIYPYGVNRDHVEQAVRHLDGKFTIVRRMESATHVLTTRKMAEKRDHTLDGARAADIEILTARQNSYQQILALLKRFAE